MARASFGGGAADFVFTPTAGGLLKLAPATLTMWTAQTGGTQITDLLVNGAPATTITVGADGQIPTFQGPDGVVSLWASAGGARVKLVDLGNLDTTDGAVTALDGNPASQLRVQQDARLKATYAPGASVIAHGAGTAKTAAQNATAFNAAITANPGGVIYVPAGTYLIDADHAAGKSILLNQTGTTLLLHPGAVLRAATNALDRYAVVRITATDCAVIGGTIEGDVGTHTGTTGEWGHGVEILEAAHRAKVDGVRITKCWGDGICVADTSAAFTTGARPADVQINNVISDNNRRQGISVIASLRLQINGGAYINTGQTSFKAPGAGIGVEANAGGLQANTDIVITGPVCSRNKGRGAYFNSAANELSATLNGVRSIDNDSDGFAFDFATDVTLNGCVSDKNGVTGATSVDGFFVASNVTKPITFNGCTARANKRMGFISNAPDTAFTSCRAFDNGWAGFAGTANRPTFTACRASGNNQISNFYGQFMLDGGADAHLVGCVSEAGQGATKVGWGFQVAATVTNARFAGCTASGAFTAGKFLDSGTNTGMEVGMSAALKLGFYGAAPSAKPTALTASAAAAPAGGVGAAAGGWDTAANRDAAIATINNLKTRVDELETKLRALGLIT